MPGSLFTVGVLFSSHNLFWQIMAQYSIEISQKQRKLEKMGKIQKFKQKNGISMGFDARAKPEASLSNADRRASNTRQPYASEQFHFLRKCKKS
ncbi:MAG: hypothetical protein IKA71_06085, partial [Lentisphaeria bacterium]|nr:hypothetical protein [Lentisphaeria bacterium]